jgi:hypothetical protein
MQAHRWIDRGATISGEGIVLRVAVDDQQARNQAKCPAMIPEALMACRSSASAPRLWIATQRHVAAASTVVSLDMLIDMKTSDWVIAFATIAGPILAVQAQKYLERWQWRRQQRIEIFYALMGTRGTRLAPAHVNALNRIELEFRPRRLDWLFRWRAEKDKAVIEAWRIYAGLLDDTSKPSNADVWMKEYHNLFYVLLHKLSVALGYNYEMSELLKGAYHPQGHGELERLQQELLMNAVKVVKGETALAMRVVQFPFDGQPVKSTDDVILDAIMSSGPGKKP